MVIGFIIPLMSLKIQVDPKASLELKHHIFFLAILCNDFLISWFRWELIINFRILIANNHYKKYKLV